MFSKVKEFGISLNLDKCAFMVFLGMILRFIVSKKGKLPYLKKIQAIVQMHVSTNKMVQSIDASSRILHS
jgi:hypothetical protein